MSLTFNAPYLSYQRSTNRSRLYSRALQPSKISRFSNYPRQGIGDTSRFRNLDITDLSYQFTYCSIIVAEVTTPVNISLKQVLIDIRPWSCLGAFVTAASMLFEPSVQQLLVFDQIVENSHATISWLPSTNRATLPRGTDFRLSHQQSVFKVESSYLCRCWPYHGLRITFPTSSDPVYNRVLYASQAENLRCCRCVLCHSCCQILELLAEAMLLLELNVSCCSTLPLLYVSRKTSIVALCRLEHLLCLLLYSSWSGI